MITALETSKTTPIATLLPGRLISLLENDCIDWEGTCEFDRNGNFVKFVRSSSRNSLHMRPIPRDEVILRDVREADKLLSSVMKSPDKGDFASVITRLSLHCGLQTQPRERTKLMLMDYWVDIGHLPLVLIEKACQKYRLLPENNNFMPKSGKLFSLVESEFNTMKLYKRRIDMILGHIEINKPKTYKNHPTQLNQILGEYYALARED